MTRENKIPKEESPNNSWYEMKQAQIATWAWEFFIGNSMGKVCSLEAICY